MYNKFQDGKCNKCGCRDGELSCTTLESCRDDSNQENGDPERKRMNSDCDKCMDMPVSPVCAMREQRTFPTRCHAMKCQNIDEDRLDNGACRDRVRNQGL